MILINTVEKLKDYVNHGNHVDYVFFWKHKNKENTIDNNCFSQWFECSFKSANQNFNSAEQYVMYRKAVLFKDERIKKQVMTEHNPGKIQELGRKVSSFNDKEWNNQKYQIAIDANLLKFSQNDTLRNYLINTGEKVLVEASPHDNIWGIGMDENDDRVTNPNLWKGQNLLGFALMEVRHILMQEIA